MENRFLFIQDYRIVNTLCEHVLTSKYPSVIGIDTETSQYTQKYTPDSLKRPPFDTLQICFDGSLGLDGMVGIDTIDPLPISGQSGPNIDFLTSTTLVISMTSIWQEWVDSYRQGVAGTKKDDPYSSMMTILMRSSDQPTTSTRERIPFSDYLQQKVPRLIELICDSSIVKVGCALENDLTEFELVLGKQVPATIDIQTLSKSLGWPELSLEKLSNRCLGKGKFKVNILSNWSSPKLSRKLIQYAAADALLTLRVYQFILGMLKPCYSNTSLPCSKELEVEHAAPFESGNIGDDELLDQDSALSLSYFSPISLPTYSTSPTSSSFSHALPSSPALTKRQISTNQQQEPYLELNQPSQKETSFSIELPDELYRIAKFLRSQSLFRGKEDPHISKVISAFSTAYAPWVRAYSPAIRKKKANQTIQQLIQARILHADTLLHTVSFNPIITHPEAQSYASQKVGQSYNSIKRNAIRHLKSIFPSAAYPLKMANVLQNRYYSSERFSKYLARALLMHLIKHGEVLKTPSGMVTVR